MCLKIIVLLTVFATCHCQTDDNRCTKGKAAAYCGSNTRVEKQYFYDVVSRNCAHYNYCVAINETENILENRFSSEEACVKICVKKKSSIVSIITEPGSKTSNTSKIVGRKDQNVDTSKKQELKDKQIPEETKSNGTLELRGIEKSTTGPQRSHGYQPVEVTEAETIDPRDSVEESDIRKQKDPIPANKQVCYEPKPYEYCGQNTEQIEAWYFDSDQQKCVYFTYCTVKKWTRNVITNNRFKDVKTCENTCLN